MYSRHVNTIKSFSIYMITEMPECEHNEILDDLYENDISTAVVLSYQII